MHRTSVSVAFKMTITSEGASCVRATQTGEQRGIEMSLPTIKTFINLFKPTSPHEYLYVLHLTLIPGTDARWQIGAIIYAPKDYSIVVNIIIMQQCNSPPVILKKNQICLTRLNRFFKMRSVVVKVSRVFSYFAL